MWIPFTVFHYDNPKPHPFKKQWVPHLLFSFVIYCVLSLHMNCVCVCVCVCVEKHDNLTVDISMKGE